MDRNHKRDIADILQRIGTPQFDSNIDRPAQKPVRTITPDSWFAGTDEDQAFFEEWMIEHGLWPESGDLPPNYFIAINLIDLGEEEVEVEGNMTDQNGKTIYEGLEPKMFTKRIKAMRPLNCESCFV